MKSVDCWNDLRQFGIDMLTGEACAFGMRLLCDVSEKGAKTIREFFGLPYNAPLGENWNSGRNSVEGEHVGSVMIPYELRSQLAVFCLLCDGAAAVSVSKSGHVVGYYPEDDAAQWAQHIEFMNEAQVMDRTYSPMGGPRVGSRMVHLMTGRVD